MFRGTPARFSLVPPSLLPPALMLCAIALLWPSAAGATLGPPVKVRLASPPTDTVVGSAVENAVVFTPMIDGLVSNVQLSADVYTSLEVSQPVPLATKARQGLQVPFRAIVVGTAAAGTAPAGTAAAGGARDFGARDFLEVSFEFEGMPWTTWLDISPAAAARARGDIQYVRQVAADALPVPAVDADALGARGIGARALERAAPSRRYDREPDQQARAKAGLGEDPPAGAGPSKARDITLHGWFGYVRSDGTFLGADGAAIYAYDEDSGWDESLGSVATDASGNFSMTFNWDPCFGCDGQPDIYIVIETANSRVEVTDSNDNVYAWQTTTLSDFGGTDHDFGNMAPSSETDDPSTHLLTDLTRNWRWLQSREGYDLNAVQGIWPDGNAGAWYIPGSDEIHISTAREWNEDTHAHEYGHHFIQYFAIQTVPAYCNGICDNNGCGHCIWCQENANDAFNEGWPNWLADVLTRSYQGDYGIAPLNFRSQEAVQTCGAALDVATITEGFLGAVCRDIEDSVNEDDPLVPGTFADALSLGTDEIFDVVDFDQPTTPMGFLNAFKARFPGVKEQLWSTAKNNGFEIDVSNPAAVTSLTSTSHSTSGNSPDPTIDYSWTRATDDCAGVAGYDVTVATGGAPVPGTTQDIGDVTAFTTSTLAPGTYWISIRTQDRAGRWSSTYASFGPITIRAAEPANLAFLSPATGWAYPLVPRGAGDATSSSVPAPITLPGDVASTYHNLIGLNNGESTTSSGHQGNIYVDGVWRVWLTWGATGAGGVFYGNNLVPIFVTGGRHTHEALLDDTHLISETSELDNEWARQWVWTPSALAFNTSLSRATPPNRTGGLASIQSGSVGSNCDGMRVTTASSNGWWHAVVVRPPSATADYDAQLHVPSTGASDGFLGNLAWSARLFGCTDAVILNHNNTPFGTFDVGVLGYGGSGNYNIRHIASTFVGYPFAGSVTLAAGEMMLLREFAIAIGQTGPVSLTARITAGTGPLYLGLLREGYVRGQLPDLSVAGGNLVTVNGAAQARLDTTIPVTGYDCLVLYRDPKDGTGAVTVTLQIAPTPPDYRPVALPGWHAPLVPRNFNDGAPTYVPIPSTLVGDSAATWINTAYRNESPAAAPTVAAPVSVDGVVLAAMNQAGTSGFTNLTTHPAGAYTVRGGRHTLTWSLDPSLAIEEIREDNNLYGEQWIWTPLQLAVFVPVTRAAPPDRTAGWTQITTGETAYFNCDGLRTPSWDNIGNDGRWGGVAVLPTAGTNVDARLHERSTGAKDGFAVNLRSSTWGTEHSDYLLMNFQQTTYRPFDVGVVATSGTGGYTAQAVRSIFLATQPQGTYGPFLLPIGELWHLHDVWLAADSYTITLHNLNFNLDWGIALHPMDKAYQSKSDALPGGTAYLAPGGADEVITVDVPTDGYYALAVWKTRSSELSSKGTYELIFANSATAAPPAVPGIALRTALGAIHPNPFNPRTTVQFELASPGEVRLEVFDLRGARVRTLASGSHEVGSHAVPWNGVDDTGVPVASGVYVVRLSAAGVSEARKVILAK